MTMDPDLPPAPQIDGEAMLEIFVHRNLRPAGLSLNPDSPYNDGGRLATLGGKTLEAVYIYLLFRKHPPLTAEALDVRLLSAFMLLADLTCTSHRRN